MVCVKNMGSLMTNCELLLLMVIVLAAPQLALATGSSVTPDLTEAVFDHLPLNNALFTGDVLQDVQVRSQVECCQSCVEAQGCVMCSFRSTPPGLPGFCRLYRKIHAASDVKQILPGVRSMARRPCAEGYVVACDRCLKTVKSTNVSHSIAKQQCSQMKGQLVMVKTRGELNCIWGIMQSTGMYWTWVGADAIEPVRVFRWNDGTLLSDYSSLWAFGEPDHDHAALDCVQIRTAAALWDNKCSRTYPFICQHDKS